MTALRRLAAAHAACNVLTTTVTLPASDTTAIDSSLASVPAACTVQENSDYDNYSITVPVPYSAVKCSQAKKALSSFAAGHGNAWTCQPYGNWIIVIFAANKNFAGGVNKAMKKTFPRFNFPCANSQRVEADPGLERKGFPDVPAACTLEQRDTYDLYEIFFPLGFSGPQRQQAKMLLSPYINDSTWEYLVFGASGAVDFQAPKNSADRIDKQMTMLLPAWNHRCADQSVAKAASDLERKDTVESKNARNVQANCEVFGTDVHTRFVVQLPVGFSDTQCLKTKGQLVHVIDVCSFTCVTHGTSTTIHFRAYAKEAGLFDGILHQIYPSWAHKCADPNAANGASDLERKDNNIDWPASCVLFDNGSYDSYVVSFPNVNFSDARCDKARIALRPYVDEPSLMCTADGISTTVQFNAPKNSEKLLNKQMAIFFDSWDHKCADPHVGGSPVPVLERKDTLDAVPAVCKVLKKGDFAKYAIRFLEGLPDAKCRKLQMSLVEYIDAPSFMWNEVGKSTVVKFNADENNAKIIDKQLSAIYGSWGQKCADPEASTWFMKNDTTILDDPKPPIAPNAQSCLAEDHGLYATWRVQIGEPFDFTRCESFGDQMYAHEFAFNTYGCREDGNGDISMFFDDTINSNGFINQVAHDMWPEINGFNCPSH